MKTFDLKNLLLGVLLPILFLTVMLAGCTTPEERAANKRQRLLAVYLPSKTTRADVQQRWSKAPGLSETRPASGWSGSAHPAIHARAAASEHRTGQIVHRCERYFGPDGWSGGLCYCWFYYDDSDRLVDAEWQWHTD